MTTKSEKHTSKQFVRSLQKAGTTPKRKMAEFKDMPEVNLGDTLTVDIFSEEDWVDVTGISKGRGFQGVVKRHGFGGVGGQTHGQHNRQRKPVRWVLRRILSSRVQGQAFAGPDGWRPGEGRSTSRY